jgi:hypothetical protein
MAENTGITTESYFKIMTENLGMWHLSTKFKNSPWLNKDKIELPFAQTLCKKLKQIRT